MSKPFGLNLECIEWHEALILVGVWIIAWIIWSLISTGIHAQIQKWCQKKLKEMDKEAAADVAKFLPERGMINLAALAGSVRRSSTEDQGQEPKDLSELSIRDRCNRFGYTYFFLKPFVFTRKSKIALASLVTWAVAKFLMDLSC